MKLDGVNRWSQSPQWLGFVMEFVSSPPPFLEAGSPDVIQDRIHITTPAAHSATGNKHGRRPKAKENGLI